MPATERTSGAPPARACWAQATAVRWHAQPGAASTRPDARQPRAAATVTKNGTDACDGTDLGGATCASALGGADYGGTLGCTTGCAYDTSQCTWKSQTPVATALCTSHYSQISYSATGTIRGTWQYNPGGVHVSIPGGTFSTTYPCGVFRYDGNVRPSMSSPSWVSAPNGQFVSFSETSTISTPWSQARFRYFRSLVYVPTSAAYASLKVRVTGVDDSAQLVLFNADHPQGISPSAAGTSDATVGACVGNGSKDFDFTAFVKKGAVNAFLLMHADLNPSTSRLTSADVLADGVSIQTYDCSTATE